MAVERHAFWACGLALVLASCGSQPKLRSSGPHSADVMFAGTEAEPSPPAAPAAPATQSVARASVDRTIDEGLGRFLQWVEIKPVHGQAGFVGFRLIEVRHPGVASIGLVPGDIVTSVNGLPIGLPEEALEVWERLRDATGIVVDYVRAGKRRQLVVPIVD